MRTKNLGYDRDQVLTIDYQDYQPRAQYDAFRRSLLTNSNIQRVATASNPASNIHGRNLFTVESNHELTEMGFKSLFIDADYLATMGMKLVAGRGFSHNMPADTLRSVLINEAAVKRMGWQQPVPNRVRTKMAWLTASSSRPAWPNSSWW